MSNVSKAYEIAKEVYAGIGVDTDQALEKLKSIKISLNCWQGDDLNGFLFQEQSQNGGIQATGNYPGKARNCAELRQDVEKALSMIPGNHKDVYKRQLSNLTVNFFRRLEKLTLEVWPG